MNDPPNIEPQTFDVDENSANRTLVGTVAADDVDNGDTRTFIVLGVNGDPAFAVNLNIGEITVADSAQLDFEASPRLPL